MTPAHNNGEPNSSLNPKIIKNQCTIRHSEDHHFIYLDMSGISSEVSISIEKFTFGAQIIVAFFAEFTFLAHFSLRIGSCSISYLEVSHILSNRFYYSNNLMSWSIWVFTRINGIYYIVGSQRPLVWRQSL